MTLPIKPLTHVRKQLTAQDRCDGCGVQAKVTVIVNTTELLLCNHHYNKHKEALKQYIVLKSFTEEYDDQRS